MELIKQNKDVTLLWLSEDNTPVFHILVNESLQNASAISGIVDCTYLDNRYDPKSQRNKGKLTPDGRIPLFRKGDDLLVRLNKDGSLSYLSNRFGRTFQISNSAMELIVEDEDDDEEFQTIRTLIKNATDVILNIPPVRKPNPETTGVVVPKKKKIPTQKPTSDGARQKVKEHFVSKILSCSIPIDAPKQKNEGMSILKAQYYAVRKLCVGDKPFVLADLLIQQHSLIASQLIQRYRELVFISDEQKRNWIMEQLNENIPEWYTDTFLTELGTEPTIEQWFQMIAQWEAMGQLEKRAETIIHAIGLWYFAFNFLSTDLTKYRNELSELFGGELPPMDTLKAFASDLKMSLSNQLRVLNRVSPIRAEPVAGAGPVDLLKPDFSSRLQAPHPIADVNLGPVTVRTDIQSSIKEFRIYREYKIKYPPSVIRALAELIVEYNNAFSKLVEGHTEWESDYAPCSVEDNFINRFVQIDMPALSEKLLRLAPQLNISEIKECLRMSIFEIENSLAMYNLMRFMFRGENGNSSLFQTNFDAALDRLRDATGKKIALAALTEKKFVSMAKTELGIADATPGTQIASALVRDLTGFDDLFSPEQLVELIRTGKIGNYLLYVRPSLPVELLENPANRTSSGSDFLADDNIRRVLREHALTMSLDNPAGKGWEKVLNDNKAWMEPMGFGVQINDISELDDERFHNYLTSRGFAPEYFDSVVIRAKPAYLSYGAYGHVTGPYNSREFRSKLASEIEKRGPYVLQIEVRPRVFRNTHKSEAGLNLHAIDRVFYNIEGTTSRDVTFIGGFRNMLPEESVEAKKGRIHGNVGARFSEIN